MPVGTSDAANVASKEMPYKIVMVNSPVGRSHTLQMEKDITGWYVTQYEQMMMSMVTMGLMKSHPR